MFAVDEDKSISPVDAFIDSPAGALVNVPPAKPVIDGVGSAPLRQKVVVEYVNEASSNTFIVIETSELFGHEPDVV